MSEKIHGIKYWAQEIVDNYYQPVKVVKTLPNGWREISWIALRKQCQHYWQIDMSIETKEFLYTCPKCGEKKSVNRQLQRKNGMV